MFVTNHRKQKVPGGNLSLIAKNNKSRRAVRDVYNLPQKQGGDSETGSRSLRPQKREVCNPLPEHHSQVIFVGL